MTSFCSGSTFLYSKEKCSKIRDAKIKEDFLWRMLLQLSWVIIRVTIARGWLTNCCWLIKQHITQDSHFRRTPGFLYWEFGGGEWWAWRVFSPGYSKDGETLSVHIVCWQVTAEKSKETNQKLHFQEYLKP